VGIAWVGLWIIGSAVATILGGIHRQSVFRTIRQEEIAQGNIRQNTLPVDPDAPPAEHDRRNRGMSGEQWQQLQQRVERAEAESAPSNWRPLCSYTANLQRIGEALLDTDAAWVEIGRAVEVPRAALKPFLGRGKSDEESAPINNRRLADQLVPQHPWIWSAGVLVGLLGLSIWTLSTRVKSLDRLK
jgi:hypothetical protein